ncbi:MAG: DUF1003 domain-containing protein [Saprospiraceae bacterium]
MEYKDDPYLSKLIQTENKQLKKLHQIVRTALEEEKLLSQTLTQAEQQTATTFGERLADRVAEFGGSWKFIISFAVVMLAWIALNSVVLAQKAFDPYPYILLNLMLSCLAALQAPIIMMSQNRQEAKDRQRAQNDYLINLKAEIEIRNLHRKLDLSIEEQYQHMCKIQQRQLEILQRIEQKLLTQK